MSTKIKKFLEKIARETAPGPTPTFSVLHILRTIELIAEKPTGRSKLAEKLKVGQGAVRTIINRLKHAGLISTSKDGCKLTSKGMKIWEEYRKIFSEKVEIERNKLIPANYNFAVLAKNCGHKIKSGIEQRDAAVKAGANGAAVIVYKNGRFSIPSVSDDTSRDFPDLTEQLIKLQPKENDVIIVGGADTIHMAEYGTIAATWTLINDC